MHNDVNDPALRRWLVWWLYRTRSGLILRSLGESPESAHALGYPVRRIRLAAVVAGWDRRKLLVWSLLWFGLWHLLAALAPGFYSLLGFRAMAMVAAAIFTPQAASCIGLLVQEKQRGQAMTFVFLGWSIASVLGMPVGSWIGGHFGWRWSMGLIGLMSMAGAYWLWRQMPAKVLPPALSMAAWRQTLSSRTIWVTLSVTMMMAAGQFVLFSYMAPFAKARFGVSPGEFSLLLLAYGSMGFVGNALLSRFIDRIGAARCILISLSFMCLSLLLASEVTHATGMALALGLWGLGGFSSNSAQQARLAAQAPWLASASISLNTSAMYAGQAIGATVGGWTLVHLGMGALPQHGLIGLLLAIGLSLLATHYARLHPLRSPEKA